MRDGLGHAVVTEDAVDIVVNGPGLGPHLDHDIEAHTLGPPPFGLEGSDLDLDHVIAQRYAVQRPIARGCLRPLGGMREGEVDIGIHAAGL